MKNALPRLALSLTAMLMAGCASSQSARIKEKSAVYASLTPRQQAQIKAGKIKVGFTADMVYLALGKPSRVSAASTLTGRGEEWVYNRYIPYLNSTTTGYPPIVGANARSQDGRDDHSDSVEVGPDIYTLELTFRAGRVVAIKLVG